MRKDPDIIQRMRGGAVTNITNNNIEYAAGGKFIKQMFASGGDVTTNISSTVSNSIPKEQWNPTVGRLSQTIPQAPDFDIESISNKRDGVMKQINNKERRDSDMEDFVMPPKVIIRNTTQKVINNIGSSTNAVYISPTPMFTC